MHNNKNKLWLIRVFTAYNYEDFIRACVLFSSPDDLNAVTELIPHEMNSTDAFDTGW